MTMEAASGVLDLSCKNTTLDPVQYTFSTAACNGMTVVRVFGHGTNATLPLQISPGTASTLNGPIEEYLTAYLA